MANDLQNFDTDECKKLLPQGTVLSEQRFVRTTILEANLDDVIDDWLDDDGTVIIPPLAGRPILGLPPWVISKAAIEMTAPVTVKVKSVGDVAIGIDRVFFPGYQKPASAGIRHSVTQQQVDKDGSSIKLGKKKKLVLSKKQRQLLSSSRSLQVKSGDDLVLIVLEKQKRPRKYRKTVPAKVTQTLSFQVENNKTQQYHQFNFLLNKAFEGDRLALIEALIADKRAGSFYNPSFSQIDLISNFNDTIYAVFLKIAKEFVEWGNYRNSLTPRMPSFPIAAVSVFIQQQTLQGFSRGRLIESLTLGPEEEVEIEVFSFEKFTSEISENRETEVGTETQRTTTQSINIEISQDIENTIGASVGGDLGLSLPVEAVNVEGGVSGEVRNEVTTRNSSTANQLTEAVNSASERFKAKHQIKTLTRRSSGTETRTTRTFKNPNLGRTLNLHNFELLATYKVKTEVDDTPRLALIVENPEIGPFTRDWIRANQHFLDSVLLHDVYRDGFEAAQVLAAQEWINELAAAEKRAREEEQQLIATGNTETVSDNYIPNKGIFATARRLRAALKHFEGFGDLEDALDDLANHVDPTRNISLQSVLDAEDLISKWAWWTQFNAAYPDTQSAAEEFILAIDQAEARVDDPAAADDVIVAVGGFVERFDDDWLVALKTFATAYLLAELVLFPAMANPLLYTYVMKLLYLPNDKGLPKIISSARAEYAQHKAKQAAETLSPPRPAAEDLKPTDLPPPPPRGYSEKEQAESHAALNRLVLHLNEEKVYYTNAFYKQESSAMRMDRLNNIGIAPFVENRLLGFSGRSAIYPLRLSALPESVQKFAMDLVSKDADHAVDPVPEETVTISIPTGGYVSEAAIGECDVLEPYLQERREIEKRAATAQVELLELTVQEKQKSLDSVTD